MNSELTALLQHPLLWRTGVVRKVSEAIPTGFADLDARLPNGGWPAQGMVEVLSARPGYSELMLLAPAMGRVMGQGGWVALVAPPFEPYAPAFVDAGLDPEKVLVMRTARAAWAMEQVLRAGVCRIVLGWSERMQDKSLRRLQLAAEQKQTLFVLGRHESHRRALSPAALRMTLSSAPGGLELDIFKSRGGKAGQVRVSLMQEHGSRGVDVI